MRKYNIDYCEGLDAALFNGDDFIYKENLEELKVYLDRWNRKVIEIEIFIKEEQNGELK